MIVAGGPVRRSDGGVVGAAAVDFVRQFKVDYAVIGTSAIDEDGALLDFDYREVRVARAIIENARQVILVADRRSSSAPPRAHRPSQRSRYLHYGRVALGSVAGGLRRARREGGRGRRERRGGRLAFRNPPRHPRAFEDLRPSEAHLPSPILGSPFCRRGWRKFARHEISEFRFRLPCLRFCFHIWSKPQEKRRDAPQERAPQGGSLRVSQAQAFDLAIIGGGDQRLRHRARRRRPRAVGHLLRAGRPRERHLLRRRPSSSMAACATSSTTSSAWSARP